MELSFSLPSLSVDGSSWDHSTQRYGTKTHVSSTYCTNPSQFTTIVGTIETLFSLLNGDDIYNTYILLEPQVDLAAYIYSRAFLYIFLGLFVYGVLNLFTSLVISAHEISQV